MAKKLRHRTVVVTRQDDKLKFMVVLKIVNIGTVATLRINLSRPYKLAKCAIGDPWSTSSDTHHVIDIQKEASEF